MKLNEHAELHVEGGGKYMEVNRRAVYDMRSIGVGHNPVKNYVVS